jgi:two-component system, chemotaxis family, chemotaxis protein CheY
MRVLIVDDSRAMRAMLASIMVDLGFEVVEARCGAEALERVANDPVELALVSWHMPEMDGLTFVSALRADPNTSGTKVMMVTAHDDMAKIARALVNTTGDGGLTPLTRDAIIPKLEGLGLVAV